MPRALAGTLVECDPSIKAIIMKIDADNGHGIVIEDINDEFVLVKTARHDELKELLKEALKGAVKTHDPTMSDPEDT